MWDEVRGTIFKLYTKCICIQTLYQVHMHATVLATGSTISHAHIRMLGRIISARESHNMGWSAWNHIQTLYEVHMHSNFISSAYAFRSNSHRKHYITCTYQVRVALHKGFLVSTLDVNS